MKDQEEKHKYNFAERIRKAAEQINKATPIFQRLAEQIKKTANQ